MAKRRYISWKKFPPKTVSQSWDKSGKRLQQGLCIGCGLNPRACKNHNRPRPARAPWFTTRQQARPAGAHARVTRFPVESTAVMVNRSIPSSTVIPEVPYTNIGQAIEWLCEAFGFTLRLRIADHRAQLNVGEGAVVLTEADPNSPSRSSVLVRQDDVNAHHERVRQSGARILRPPTDYPFG